MMNGVGRLITHTTESPAGRFVVDSLRYLPSSVLPAFFSIAAVMVFTRTFAPAEYGVYSLALAITGPLTTILTEWAAQPTGRFYPEYEAAGQGSPYRQLVAVIVVFVGAAIAVLSLLTAAVLAGTYGAVPRPVVYAGAVLVVATQAPISIVMPLLPASLRAAQYGRAMVATGGLSVVCSLALVALLGADAAWLLWGQALASAIVLPYVFRSAGIDLGTVLGQWAPQIGGTLRRFLKYGVPMMVWMFAYTLLNVGDRYVIQLFWGSDAVAVYSVNYGLVSLAVGLINVPVITAAFPILTHQWARKETAAARQTLAQMTDLYLLVGFGLLGGVAVIDRPLVDLLLGPEFRAGYVIHVAVAAGTVLWGASILGHKSMELAERTTLMVVFALVAAAVNMLLNFVFVPGFGYVAAAYTTLASYAIYFALVWWRARYLLPWDISPSSVVIGVAAALVAWVVAEAALGAAEGPIPQLAVGAFCFSCIYLVLSLSLRYPGRAVSLAAATLERVTR